MRSNGGSVVASRPRTRVLLFGLTGCALTLGLRCLPIIPEAGTPELADDDHVLAVGEPAVTVFEFSSFACHACGRFARETWPTIRQEYVDTGKVRWVARHMPFSGADSAAGVAAQASECAADQGMFWEYRELVFANQSDLGVATLKSYAADLEMDTEAFDACLDSGGKADEVEAQRAAGRELGVYATPFFFVDGEPLPGFRTVEEFRDVLEAALAAVGAE